jgi:uncharacterized membrane protein YfbV (UPF0208 family)
MKIKENLLSETVSKTENHILLVMLNERSEMKYPARNTFYNDHFFPYSPLFTIIIKKIYQQQYNPKILPAIFSIIKTIAYIQVCKPSH